MKDNTLRLVLGLISFRWSQATFDRSLEPASVTVIIIIIIINSLTDAEAVESPDWQMQIFNERVIYKITSVFIAFFILRSKQQRCGHGLEEQEQKEAKPDMNRGYRVGTKYNSQAVQK